MVVIQNLVDNEFTPSKTDLINWAELALANNKGEVTIRIVSLAEMQKINFKFRGFKTPTNVLSFPFEMPDISSNEIILGDVIICAQVVNQEAKQTIAHWAHITIHGVLHLLGYDHMNKKDALIMSTKEVKLLAQLGFPNPYS